MNPLKVKALLSMFLVGWATAMVWACDTPVYQYSRINWDSDAYDILVFHRGVLPDESARLVSDLREAEKKDNFVLHVVDLAARNKQVFEDIFKKTGLKTLPGIALLYPPNTVKDRVVWSAPLSAPNIKKLLDSPARKMIFRALNTGNAAAVWVFLPGTGGKESATCEKRLRKLLKEIGDELKKELATEDDREPPSFQVLRVERDAPGEEVLWQMLGHIEPDLGKYRDQSMVVPVFGRGRALFALVGEGINRDTISQTVGFLLGACSCEVKAMNPGVDLLLRGQWEEVEGDEMEYGEVALAPLQSVSAMLETADGKAAEPELSPTTETATAPAPEAATDDSSDPAAEAPVAATKPSAESALDVAPTTSDAPTSVSNVIVGSELPEARSRLAETPTDTGKVILLWLALGTIVLGMLALAAGGVVWWRLGRNR